MTLRGFVTGLALLLSLMPAAARAGTTGGLIIRVTDAATGIPIAGAEVTAKGYSGSVSGVTDPSGEVRFNSLAPDAYSVTIEKAGYGPHTEDSGQ